MDDVERKAFMETLEMTVEGINSVLDGRAEIRIRDPMSDEETESLLDDAGLSSAALIDSVDNSEVSGLGRAIDATPRKWGEQCLYFLGVGGSGVNNANGAGMTDRNTRRLSVVSWFDPPGVMAHELLHCFGVGHITTGDHFMRGGFDPRAGSYRSIPMRYATTTAADEVYLPLSDAMVSEIVNGPGCDPATGCVEDWGEWPP
jgi:hypothetical protein